VIRCCVPFCPHSTDKWDDGEWLCPEHWRLVPRWARRRLRIAKALARRHDGSAHYRLHLDFTWQVCARRAIEAAFGIG
jgi:hypothetical protein